MRILSAVILVPILAAGCTPYIPVRDDFGTSALIPAGEVPRDYAAFNAYDPSVNGLVAEQICATPAMTQANQSLAAVPGQIIQSTSRCQTHIPIVGNEPWP